MQLHWLTRESQEASWLCLPRAGVTGAQSPHSFFTWVLGLELGSLCLSEALPPLNHLPSPNAGYLKFNPIKNSAPWELSSVSLHTFSFLAGWLRNLTIFSSFTWAALLQSEGRDEATGLDLVSLPSIPGTQSERPTSGFCYFSK